MTADVELLPLPEWTKRDDAGQNMVPSEIRVSMADYARANVAHATATRDAEIEALRAEVAAWIKSYDRAVDLWQQHRDRAERLAEALRAFPTEPNPYTYRIAHAKARAALHPTAAQENYDA